MITMMVNVKVHPMAQSLNGVKLGGISGFRNSFCEKNKFRYLQLPTNNQIGKSPFLGFKLFSKTFGTKQKKSICKKKYEN